MMEFGFKTKSCRETSGVIMPFFEDKIIMKHEELKKMIEHLKKTDKFNGKLGEMYNFTREIDGVIQDIVLIGLGKEEEINLEKIKVNISKAYKKLKELKDTDIAVRMIRTDAIETNEILKAMTIALELTDYTFDKYKSKKEDKKDVFISFTGCNVSDIEEEDVKDSIEEGIDIANGVVIARDLVNEPANEMYPEVLGFKVQELGETFGFEVEVLGQEKIEELGMEAFLSVAKGSTNEPKLIVMRYFGDNENKKKRLGLVGKGLTFDSGGYSLKPTDSMATMKSDMGGAAAVIGAMTSIAKRDLKINVIGVVAACENMIDGNAYKAGDIIGSMAGKTIEVLNTDAEGRLTLADAMTYIKTEEKVTEIVELATLTGAALVALGETTTALVTNNDDLCSEVVSVSEYTGERAWKLPAFEEYKELIKSDIADLKNIGGRYAGTITAGLFVGEFAEETPWVHMDIAGTAWTDKPVTYKGKGGTGVPVNTIYELAKGRANR
ncbi:leucyl aminopeptidase [Clostridium chrysemydis]|uniref:leucyl aminopeptidase n=1 Tax=Clostridium chrysemydis TaxID=2665504 RepID=UPI003B75C373